METDSTSLKWRINTSQSGYADNRLFESISYSNLYIYFRLHYNYDMITSIYILNTNLISILINKIFITI